MGGNRIQLFDDNNDNSSSSSDDLSKIEIDHDFAKRLEHNKQREDLQRLQELKKQGRVDASDDSSEDSSDSEPDLKKPDAKFFKALLMVKNKDPILFDKDAKLFDFESESSENEEKGVKKMKKQKPLYLKDVVSKQVIEKGPEFDDEEMDNDSDDDVVRKVKTYSEEQEEIRNKLIKDLEDAENENENGEENDLFKVKDNGVVDEDDGEEIKNMVDGYFGDDGKLDEDSKFLKKFFEEQMWQDKDKGKGIVDDDGVELSEDEEEVERQEDYEREFNFRFEENVGDRVMGHSRKVEGSVRKVDSARKSQRERKKERMKQAEEERKKELKRLKNLKKKEINEKLDKIRKVAGIGNDGDIGLDEDDLSDEFDPEEHDRKMRKAFGDKYYNAKDVNPEFGSDEDDDGLVKPDFEGEDELLGLEKDWDKVEDYDEDGDGGRKESKRKRKRKPSDVEKAVEEVLMEEYYKLDYEGTVGDLKTRFKYKPVKANRFGLKPAELLLIDDKELNQYVPLKKLSTYKDDEFKVDRRKTLQMREKVMDIYGKQKKRKTKDSGDVAPEVVEAVEDDKALGKEPIGETSKLSRKSKRRQRQKELKLPQDRLVAYGKDASKSKNKEL